MLMKLADNAVECYVHHNFHSSFLPCFNIRVNSR